jgi:HD superfamily phosphohydrolase YqeK
VTFPVVLPAWARVGAKRRAHIERVTTLLDQWVEALEVDAEEARAWHDAGSWHDALRDAGETELLEWAGELAVSTNLLHGPAAAARLEHDGERRADVLDAVRWHTSGHPAWGRTGRALYMADFLEPGRHFLSEERQFLAAVVPLDFDGAFRQVVRVRIEWTLREGRRLFPETVALWNSVH